MKSSDMRRCVQHEPFPATALFDYVLLTVAISLSTFSSPAAAAASNRFMIISVNQSQYLGVTVAYRCDTQVPLTTTTFPLKMQRDVLGKDSKRWRLSTRRSRPAPGGGKFYTLVYLLTVANEDDGVRIDCIANLTTIGKGYPIAALQTHIQLFADPVLLGPRAVAVGTTVTWTCDISYIHYTQRSDISVYWVVLNGSLSTENIITNAQELDISDDKLSVYRVTSNATLYISDRYTTYSVKCVVQQFGLRVTKDTGDTMIRVFMMDDPVLAGPTRAGVDTTGAWTCTVVTVSFSGQEEFTLTWFIGSQLQNDSLSHTQVTHKVNTKNKFPVPVYSINSTLRRFLDRHFAPSFRLKCVARLVLLNVTRKAEIQVQLNNDGITQGENGQNGDNAENGNGENGKDDGNKKHDVLSLIHI